MIVQVWQTLIWAGLAANADAYVLKREPFWTGLFGVGAWCVAALGSLNVEVVASSGSVSSHPEYAVAVLAAVNGIVSMLVAIKAAAGAYEDQGDRLASVEGDQPGFNAR